MEIVGLDHAVVRRDRLPDVGRQNRRRRALEEDPSGLAQKREGGRSIERRDEDGCQRVEAVPPVSTMRRPATAVPTNAARSVATWR